MMGQSIVVVGFPSTEIWALENLEGYQKLVALQSFQSSYLSWGEWKHYIYHKKDTKVGN